MPWLKAVLFALFLTVVGSASAVATPSEGTHYDSATYVYVQASMPTPNDSVMIPHRRPPLRPEAAPVATSDARATGGVAAKAEGPAARFVANSAGDVLDVTRVTIPEGKFGYLLKNPSKSGVFSDSMGFDQAGLDSALRNHLVDNFGSATPSVPMTGGGTKFSVTGPMTGHSGQTWNITSAWGVGADGTVRLITATP